MGTRSGDLDPAIPGFLRRTGMADADVEDLLQHRSGLAGLCGVNDMRTVLARRADGDPRPRWPSTSTATGSASTSGPTTRCWGGWTPSCSRPASASTRRPCARCALAGLDAFGIAVDPARNEGRLRGTADLSGRRPRRRLRRAHQRGVAIAAPFGT
jgi:acetate kinase